MNQPDPEPLPDPRLDEYLSILRSLPARRPQAARRGRERFLSEAGRLKASPWAQAWAVLTSKRRPGFSPILAVLLAVIILLASAGTVVFAAQTSLPDQALYPAKLWSEDVRLNWAADPQARLRLDQEFIDRRITEMMALSQADGTVEPEVSTRLQVLVNDAIQNASGLPGNGAPQALSALTANLARHQEQLEKLRQRANPRAAAEFARLVAMLNLKQEQAAEGIHNPQALQELKQQMQAENQELTGKPKKAGTGRTENPGGGNDKGGGVTTRTPHSNNPGTPENNGKGKEK